MKHAHSAPRAGAPEIESETDLRTLLHELRAPLHAMNLNLHLVRASIDDYQEDPADGPLRRAEQIERLDAVQAEVGRLGRLLVGNEAETHRSVGTVDVGQLLGELVRYFEPVVAQRGGRLRRALPDAPLVVPASKDRLRQAFVNLIQNAIEAPGSGGSVRVSARAEGRRAVVDVEDQGEGIPAGDLEHVFELGHTTKPAGHGIGLAVARAVVWSFGGDLRIASERGVGTLARVRLPLAEIPSNGAGAPRSSMPPEPSRQRAQGAPMRR